MAKPNIPNQKAKYNALNARLNKYVLLVQQVYETYNLEASKIALSTGYDGDKPFSFSDYPITKKRLQDLLNGWRGDLSAIIGLGTANEWANSNTVQDLLADKALSYYYGKEHGRRVRKYYQTNSDSLKAFQERVDNGMNLSQKIWNQSENYQEELEAALSSGIQKGMSAVTLSKRVSKYLNDFDLLKHDYKQRYGKEVDCLNCEYRSMRLVRSEINMAYRTAEQERWQQFDFVVCYEIKLSHSHKERMPHGDICDTLAGKYPKDFKWTGWHPNDLCYAIPILKTEDEFFEGDDVSVNEVTEIPNNFKDWCAANVQRITSADKNNTLPYFLEDNQDFRKYLGVDYVANYRHRTRNEEQILVAWENREAIIQANQNLGLARFRRYAHSIGYDLSEFEEVLSTRKIDFDSFGESEVFEKTYDKARDGYFKLREEINESYQKLSELLKQVKDSIGVYKSQAIIDEIEKTISGYTSFPAVGKVYSKKEFDNVYHSVKKKHDAIIKKAEDDNIKDLELTLGVKKGHPMSFLQADECKGNINYIEGVVNPYSVNCQVCVVADELRRRGFDVTALGRIIGNGKADAIAHCTEMPWIEKTTGKRVKKKRILLIGKNNNKIYNELDAFTKSKGRYHMDWAWKNGNGNGHIVCLERKANGTLRFYDPQTGKHYDIMDVIRRIDKNFTLNILKVDDLLVDHEIIRSIVKPL